MADACTVDAELFDSLEDAIRFVAERGGGVVHTPMASTDYVKSLTLPDDVRVAPPRAEAAEAEARAA